MATARQIKAAEKLVENGGKSVSAAMRAAGYSEQTAKSPQKLTDSKGWQELLDEVLPDQMLLDALAEDIKANKGKRVPELTLAAKMKGRITDRGEVVVKDLREVLDELDDDRSSIAKAAQSHLNDGPKAT